MGRQRETASLNGVWVQRTDGTGGEVFMTADGAATALKSGEWESSRDGQTVSIVKRGDVNAVVPADEIGRLVGPGSPGDHFESLESLEARRLEEILDKQYGSGYLNSGRALLEGAARGLSLGASDILFQALGASREGLQQRRLRKSTEAVIGEVGSTVAAAVLSGGSAGLARGAARLTPAGAASRLATGVGGAVRTSLGGVRGGALTGVAKSAASLGAAGFVEGGIFGAGQGISSIALSNKPLSAELIVSELSANAFHGAALGGVVGGAFGLGGEVMSNISRVARKRTAAQASRAMGKASEAAGSFDDVARAEAGDALRSQFNIIEDYGAQARNMARQAIDEAVEPAVKKRIAANVERWDEIGAEMDEVFSSVTAKADDAASVAARAERASDLAIRNARSAARRASEGAGTVDDVLAPPPSDTVRLPAGQGGRVDEALGPFGTVRFRRFDGSKPTPKINDLAGSAKRAVEIARKRAAEPAFRHRVLDDDVAARVLSDMEPDQLAKLVPLYAEKTQLAREMLEDIIPGRNLSGAMDKALVGSLPESATKLHAIDALALANELGIDVDRLPVVGGPADLLLKGWIAGRVLGVAGKGAKAAKAAKAPRRVKGGAITEAARDVSRRQAAGAAGRGLERVVGGGRPGGVGGFLGRVLSGAVRRGGDAGTAAVGQMGTVAGGAVTRIEKLASAFVRAGKKAKPHAPRTAVQVLGAAKFNESLPRKEVETKGMSNLERQFRFRAGELIDAASNVDMTRRKIFDRLNDVRMLDPVLADQMETLALKRVLFLHDKLPPGHGRGSAVLGINRYRPSNIQMRRFARFVRAANNPVATLEGELLNGRLTPQTVETIRVLYPNLYEHTRKVIIDKVAMLRSKLNQNDRLQLSALLRVPIDTKMRPENIRKSQEFWARLKGEAGQEPNPPSQRGLDSLGKNTRLEQTTSQSLQAKHAR